MSYSLQSSRGSSTCPLYTIGGKMSDKNLEQRTNIKFCVKIGNTARDTLVLLTLTSGEYDMKKMNVIERHGRFREEREDHASVYL
jgi:hypothetical protein